MAAEFFNNLKLFLYIQKSNVKTAFLNKADALINVLMMLINNLAFFFYVVGHLSAQGNHQWLGHRRNGASLYGHQQRFCFFCPVCPRHSGPARIHRQRNAGQLSCHPQKSVVYDFNVRVDFCQLGRLPHRAAGFLLVGIS